MIELGIPITDIVASRARNEAWAGPAESLLTREVKELLEAMFVEHDELAVECTDLVCELTMTVSADTAEDAFARMQALPAPMAAPFGEILDDGRHRIGLRLLYDHEWATPEKFRLRYRALWEERFPDGLAPLRDYFANGGTTKGSAR